MAWLSVIQGGLGAIALFESLFVVIKLQKEVRCDPYYNRMRQALGSVIQLTDLISSFLPANGFTGALTLIGKTSKYRKSILNDKIHHKSKIVTHLS